jgi:hypothetical protein
MRVAALPIRSGSDDLSEKRGVNRQRPDFGIELDVTVTYYTGVRDRPLEPGNRPLCNVHRPERGDIDIGLCEVASTDPPAPDESTRMMLRFDRAVTAEVDRYLKPGTEFLLTEGKTPFATAIVIERRHLP